MNAFRKLYLLFVILLSVTLTVSGQDKVTFRLITPDIIVEGENFNVQFVLNANGKDFRMSDPAGLQVLYGPAVSSSTSMSWVNGKSSRSVSNTFTYTLLADKAGTYTIPSASVKVGSATYKTAPKSIRVYTADAAYGAGSTKAGPGSSAGQPRPQSTEKLSASDFIITANPSKNSVYEQEGVLVTFRLYSTRPNITLTKADFPPFENFVKEEVVSNATKQWSTAELGGRVYYTVNLQQVYLFPQKSGDLDIPAGTFDLVVPVKVNDPVDDFFGGFLDQYTEVKRTVKSKPFRIHVKALPETKPEGFSGAVGQFSLTSEVPKKVLKTGESYQVKLKLSGNGNFSLTSLPEPQWPEGFEAYDPEVNQATDVLASGVTGTKEVTYYAVPRYEGDYTIPATPFAYFDPAVGQFKTITIPEQKVHVDKGDGTSTKATSFTGQEEVSYLNSDIRYLKSSNGRTTIQTLSVPLLFLSYLLIALLAYALYRILLARLSGASESVESKARRAGRTARKYLKLAARKQADPDPSVYYEALQKGIESYISNKFRLPTSELSKERIRETLLGHGTGEELTNNVLGLLGDVELARFSPQVSGEEDLRGKLYGQAVAIIDALESPKKKTSK